MSMVICKLPKAGLGNQLFPLMKAIAFASLNKLPLIVTDYRQIKIGPYLRKEKNKRHYSGFFRFEKGMIQQQLDKWKVSRYKNADQQKEPSLEIVETAAHRSYLFNEIPHWSDYFDQLKEHRDLVIQLFWKTISPKVIHALNQLKPPVIGVHIRMGDFRKLQAGEEFSKVGAVRTPEEYFVNIISSIRKIHGTDLPVSVFTDGFRSEFSALFSLPAVNMVEGNADIVDLLLLSKSNIIVCSAGSTFSYWAGFLSNAPLILHPDHIHESIRPASMAHEVYEGPFATDAAVLVNNIKSI